MAQDIVERLFSNPGGEPECVKIRTGFLRTKLFLIPVQDVAVDQRGMTLTLK